MTSARHRRSVLFALLAVAALVGVAAAAQGQDRIRGDVLVNESSLIGFTDAEDTAIEEVDERPSDSRLEASDVGLRGPDTVSRPSGDEGQRAYMLGLSASAALGIDQPVLDRYANGELDDAFLELSYQNGCSSPNGELVVQAIETRSWSPFDVGWDDTTLGNGSIAIDGPELARAPISTSSAQDNPDIGCNQATLALETDRVERVLNAELGGIALTWQGEQPLNVSTLNSEDPPVLDVNFTTQGPSVDEIAVADGYPAVVDTGERFSIAVNATDAQDLPDDAVAIDVAPQNETVNNASTLEATRSGDLFVASQTFTADAEGRYTLQGQATDTDGWIDREPPDASAPHVVADGTAPEIPVATLGPQATGTLVDADEGTSLDLAANVSDLTCAAGVSPCGEWRLAWHDQTLANGTLTSDHRIQAQVPLPRPGNTTATLVVEDAIGHTNRSTTWTLNVTDTVPPTASPLEGTDLSPGQGITVENGTPIQLRAQIEDDLPVEGRLVLEGSQTIDRDLPAPDEDGLIEAEITGVPQGSYRARLVLDDGTHTRRVGFGDLTVAAQGAPSVSIDLPSTRIGPKQALDATVRDRDLDEAKTTVVAEVNGLEVQPDVDREPVENGLDLTIHLGDVGHEDIVNVTVRAQDRQGLEADARARVTVDAEPPTLVEPETDTWAAPGDTVRLSARDPGGGDVSMTLDAPQTRSAGPSPRSVTIDKLVPEPGRLVNVSVTLSDDIGNEQTTSVHVGLDDAPPEASPVFTREGLTLATQDNASGVLRVDALVGVDGEPLNETQVFQESPTRFFVATGDLTRGDEVALAAQVRDRVGHETALGTAQDPLELTVPDRAPRIEIERASATIADVGRVNWTAEDPDEDPLDVTVEVTRPDGTRETVSGQAIGSHAIEPGEPGRYGVTVEASSAGNATQASTFFYLGPEGRLVQATSVPDDVEPGRSLVVELSFASEPQQVFVTATDEDEAVTSATVDLQGSQATATFEGLPEGTYDLEATVVHEEGASETVHIASVQSQQPLGDRLGEFAIPLLILLAIGLVVAIAVLVYRQRRDEEDEDAELEPEAIDGAA